MQCTRCGTNNDPKNKFCQNCGNGLEQINSNQNNNVNQVNNNSNYNNMNQVNNNSNYNNMNQVNNNSSYNNINQLNNNSKKSDGLGIASLVLGIITVLFSSSGIVLLPFGITGLILGIQSKIKKGVATAGIILSAIGLVLTVVISICSLIFDTSLFESIFSELDTSVKGDGYTIKTNLNWHLSSKNGEQFLQYRDEDVYLLPTGISTFSELNIDFNTEAGKKELLNEIEIYLKKEEDDNLVISPYTNDFSKLTNDIYYTLFLYKDTLNNVKGTHIWLVSPKKNALVSFKTKTNLSGFDQYINALDLLETIEIETRKSTGSSNATNADKLKFLQGDWKERPKLGVGYNYWKIKDDKFWFYESYKDLIDNYIYGTVRVLTGKEGIASVGIDPNRLQEVIAENSDTLNIREDDFYTIICTPLKATFDGVMQDPNSLRTRKYIWLLIDRGDEIEAQVLDIEKGTTQYLYKN